MQSLKLIVLLTALVARLTVFGSDSSDKILVHHIPGKGTNYVMKIDDEIKSLAVLGSAVKLLPVIMISTMIMAQQQQSTEYFQCNASDCLRIDTRACMGCGIAKYCSKTCQRKDWKEGHKAKCVGFQK